MKKQLLGFLFLVVLTLGVSAQQSAEKRVDEIRKAYTKISERIAATEKDEDSGKQSDIAVDEYITNKLNRSWESVGTFGEAYRFYYQHRKEEPYPDQLIKIIMKRQSAARTYYEEYVYDESDQLIFFFGKTNDTEDPPLERRIYFNDQKPIRIIEDGQTRDKFTEKDRSKIKEVLDSNKAIRQKFG